MLLCVFLALLVGVFCDETFKNVTVFGGDKPVHIKSSSSLLSHLPQRNILSVSFGTSDVIPILHTDAISDLVHLENLDLSNHQIKIIQKGAFRDLPKLLNLLLDDNELEEIKNEIFNNLQNLECLSLKRNQIKSIQERAFDNLDNLMFLFLADNQLTSFDSDWFNDKPSLFQVDLTNNLIEEIPDGAFSNFDKSIFLGGNKIGNISRDMFGTGEQLMQLSLHDNLIEEWDEDFFENITMASFDLANNRIECLGGNYSELFVAGFTSIGGNPWNCSCLLEITEWALETDLEVSIDWSSSADACEIEERATKKIFREIYTTEWEQFVENMFGVALNY